MSSKTCPTAPYSASVCGLFDGDKGAWPKFLLHWGLRSVLIMPGYLAAGVRGKQLVFGALGSSTMISLFLMLYTAAMRGRNSQRARIHAGHAAERKLPGARHRSPRAKQLAQHARRKQLHAGKKSSSYAVRKVSTLELMQRNVRP